MRRLTTWDQAERMRKLWPQFRVMNRTKCDVVWSGSLRPLCQAYSVRVAYHREPDRRRANMCRPTVIVTMPLLHGRHEAPGDPIPHLYQNPQDPERPLLCLYDPAASEWHPGFSIARTIIPWTIDWLACYEGWLATGEWAGGGRHASSPS